MNAFLQPFFIVYVIVSINNIMMKIKTLFLMGTIFVSKYVVSGLRFREKW